MDKALSKTLVHAINALESLPSDLQIDTKPLYAFCESCGLPVGAVIALVRAEGMTDMGRLGQTLARLSGGWKPDKQPGKGQTKVKSR